jgi:hypothetical protein
LRNVFFREGYQPHRDRIFLQRLYRSDHHAWFTLLSIPDWFGSPDLFGPLLKDLKNTVSFTQLEIMEALSLPSITSVTYDGRSSAIKKHTTLLNGEIIVNHIEKKKD